MSFEDDRDLPAPGFALGRALALEIALLSERLK
jgi:hypothetical protein